MTPEHFNEYLILLFIYSQFNDGVSNSKYTVYSTQYTVYSIQYAVYSIQYTVQSIQAVWRTMN